MLGTDTRINFERARSVLFANRSPDLGFRYSLNPYRAASMGAIYCYARPTHEFLGLSAGIEELPSILRATRDHGAAWADTAPAASRYPDRANKVLSRTRKGALTDPRFGTRKSGEGPHADLIKSIFCQGFETPLPLDTGQFVRPGSQLKLGFA